MVSAALRSSRRRHRWALALVLVLAGCAGSGATYIANDELGAYLRVPADFTVYDADEVLADLGKGLPEETLAGLAAQQWTIAFDSSDDPAVDRFVSQLQEPSGELAGLVRVRTLSPEQRLRFSLQSLRGELLPEAQLQQLGDRVRVLDVEELAPEGERGLRLVYSIGLEDTTFVFEQIGLVDDAASHVYLLALGCSAECFEASQDEIAQITSSWTIEER
jgi:hypothetical protein